MKSHETWHLCRSNPSGPLADESNRWHLHGLNSRHHLQASAAPIWFQDFNGFQREKSGPPRSHWFTLTRNFLFTIWLWLTLAKWKTPTINGGVFRWENPLFRLGPSIPWRTVSHNQRVKIFKWPSSFRIFPMGIHPHHMVACFGFGAQHDVAKPSGNQTWRNPPFNVKCSN